VASRSFGGVKTPPSHPPDEKQHSVVRNSGWLRAAFLLALGFLVFWMRACHAQDETIPGLVLAKDGHEHLGFHGENNKLYQKVGVFARNATGWCKLLKLVPGFNLTVTSGWVFHKLFNRAVENSMTSVPDQDECEAKCVTKSAATYLFFSVRDFCGADSA